MKINEGARKADGLSFIISLILISFVLLQLFVVLPGGTVVVVSAVGAAVLSSVAAWNKRRLKLILFNISYSENTTNMFFLEFLKFTSFFTSWRVILLNISCA